MVRTGAAKATQKGKATAKNRIAKLAAAKNGKNGKKEEVAKTTSSKMIIKPMNIQILPIPVVGDTSMIQHKWDQKVLTMMLDKMRGKAVERLPKDPQREFEAATHRFPPKHARYPFQVGFPASGFKAAAVGACRNVHGLSMTEAKGLFFTIGFQDAFDLVPIIGSEPKLREDSVRLETGVPDLRYRPEIWPWCTVVHVKFDAAQISPEHILYIFNKAGFHSGVGEWRPSSPKSATGSHGMFHVAGEDEMHLFDSDMLDPFDIKFTTKRKRRSNR